jgi:CheY-like chemotaxis protein
VANDYKEFRELVCLLLGSRRDSQIVGEASDGSEAVRKAVELKPDLIVLDIDLPALNGIEAAQQIRERAPNSKIIFLSAETSADVVQEAFRSGAWGYVLKTNIGSELLAAVEAVLAGGQFASKEISGYNYVDATEAQVPDFLKYEESVPSFPLKSSEITRSHEAQFHSDDGSLLGGFTHFIEASLRAGNPVIVVATESHRKSLLQRLEERGVDTRAVTEQGRYIPLDVTETLSAFMVNDLPDPVRFFRVASDLLAQATRSALGKPSRVAACGECPAILWAQGNVDAAIRLEQLWDEMAKTCDADILCGYVLKSIQREQVSHIYQKICSVHSAVCLQ